MPASIGCGRKARSSKEPAEPVTAALQDDVPWANMSLIEWCLVGRLVGAVMLVVMMMVVVIVEDADAIVLSISCFGFMIHLIHVHVHGFSLDSCCRHRT